MQCAGCSAEVSAGHAFCTACGTAVAMAGVCVGCGHALAQGDLFCQQCGTRQPTPAAEQVQPAASPHESVPGATNSADRAVDRELAGAVSTSPELTIRTAHPRRQKLVLLAAFLTVVAASLGEYWYSSVRAVGMAAPLVEDVTAQVVAERIRLGVASDPTLRNEHVSVTAASRVIELSGRCSTPAARSLLTRYAAGVIADRFVLVDNTQLIPPGTRPRAGPHKR